jgi:uncharacterized protein
VEVVEPAEIGSIVVSDSDDDSVIACAIGGNVDYIVSGDHHLLELKAYNDIPIWTANQLLDEFGRR